MRVIFAKGKKSLTANLIASVCDTDVSHVALMSGYDKIESFVFHSTSEGVKVCSFNKFESLYDIKRIYEIPCYTPHFNTYHLWKLFEKYEDCAYDYLAFIYLGLFLCFKKLGIKLPAENRWQNRNHFICTEFASAAIMGQTDSMQTLKTLEDYIKENAHELCMSFDQPAIPSVFAGNE